MSEMLQIVQSMTIEPLLWMILPDFRTRRRPQSSCAGGNTLDEATLQNEVAPFEKEATHAAIDFGAPR